MKKTFSMLAFVTVVSLFAATKAHAQIALSVQLTRPPQYENNERFHPNRPSPNHIWISEEWVPNGHGSYDYRPGYWSLPPTVRYVPGHWNNTGPNGTWIWISGYYAVSARGSHIVVEP